MNFIFLGIGLVLSIASKLFQFKFKEFETLGNIIIIPAAFCFCLAILFSIPRFQALFQAEASRGQAISIAGVACLAVGLFQIMMMNVIGNQAYWTLLLLIPVGACAGLFLWL